MHLASGRQITFLWPGSEGQVSPDGKWIAQAYRGVFIRSVAEPHVHIQISNQITNSGSQPRWSRDGRQLFYIAPDKKLIAVTFDSQKGIAGAPQALFQTRIIGAGTVGFQYDVAPDGRFLINSLPNPSPPLTLVSGWTALLKH
jgi:eukaryotic-like serine/threonine-protein kinase